MFSTKAFRGLGCVAALTLGVGLASQAAADYRPHRGHHGMRHAMHHGHHGYAPQRAHYAPHHGYRHRAAHHRHHGYRYGGFSTVGYAAGGDYIGKGVIYNQPMQAAPVERSYQVPVTVNRVVTRTYQAPVTAYQAETRTEYVPVTRTTMRPVTTFQTFQRQEVVPTVEYRTVRQRCNCSWDY